MSFITTANSRWRLSLALLLSATTVLLLTTAASADNIFSSSHNFNSQIKRIGDESLDLLRRPLDTKDGGLAATLAVGGTVALAYVFDGDMRSTLRRNRGGVMDAATNAFNLLGDPYLHLGLAAAMYGGGILANSPRLQETGEMLGEAVILADATTFVLKTAIGRSRPSEKGDKGDFRPGQFKSDYDSLPSMHTSSSFAMAAVMAGRVDSMTTKALYYGAATLVGFSRVYQDKHWVSDVLLGAAIGELCGRIVNSTHARKKQSSFSLVPSISTNSAGVALLGNW